MMFNTSTQHKNSGDRSSLMSTVLISANLFQKFKTAYENREQQWNVTQH